MFKHLRCHSTVYVVYMRIIHVVSCISMPPYTCSDADHFCSTRDLSLSLYLSLYLSLSIHIYIYICVYIYIYIYAHTHSRSGRLRRVSHRHLLPDVAAELLGQLSEHAGGGATHIVYIYIYIYNMTYYTILCYTILYYTII